MQVNEHLLTCLSEECSEVIQAVSKALRFGLDDGYPGTDRTNLGDIARELDDIRGVVELLGERGVHFPSDRARIDAKKQRVIEMLGYAALRGTVECAAPGAQEGA